MQLKSQGRYKDAVAVLSQYLREDPHSIDVLAQRAGYYCEMGEFEKSLQDGNRAIKINPKSAIGYHCVGNAYKEMAMPKQAVEAYSKGLEFSTEPHETTSLLYHRGSQYASLGNYQKCIDDSTRCLEIGMGPKVDTRGQRAGAYQALHQDAKAIADYTILIQDSLKSKDKGGIKYLMHRARAYEGVGKFDKAIEDYTMSLKYQPNDEHCLTKRAECFSRSKKNLQAINDYTEVAKLDPDGWRTYLARGKEYSTIKDFKKAIEDFGRALKLDPPDPATIYEARSKAFEALGDNARASADLEQARKPKPNANFPF